LIAPAGGAAAAPGPAFISPGISVNDANAVRLWSLFWPAGQPFRRGLSAETETAAGADGPARAGICVLQNSARVTRPVTLTNSRNCRSAIGCRSIRNPSTAT